MLRVVGDCVGVGPLNHHRNIMIALLAATERTSCPEVRIVRGVGAHHRPNPGNHLLLRHLPLVNRQKLDQQMRVVDSLEDRRLDVRNTFDGPKIAGQAPGKLPCPLD